MCVCVCVCFIRPCWLTKSRLGLLESEKKHEGNYACITNFKKILPRDTMSINLIQKGVQKKQIKTNLHIKRRRINTAKCTDELPK